MGFCGECGSYLAPDLQAGFCPECGTFSSLHPRSNGLQLIPTGRDMDLTDLCHTFL
jgi:hypothetical protein